MLVKQPTSGKMFLTYFITKKDKNYDRRIGRDACFGRLMIGKVLDATEFYDMTPSDLLDAMDNDPVLCRVLRDVPFEVTF